MELHYLNDENFDYGITVFKGKAKLLENIHYTHSFFKSGYYCWIDKIKDLWINKGDEVFWHNFKNYDPNYSILKKEIFIHVKKRHYNWAEFHFKHNWLTLESQMFNKFWNRKTKLNRQIFNESIQSSSVWNSVDHKKFYGP